MPRPPKCRLVCCFPQTSEFFPIKEQPEYEAVILTVDEYETIRLIDKVGLSQEECSKQMLIARTTAQKIYDNARKKLADALVDGLPLRIEGGAYKLCNGGNPMCGVKECRIQELFKKYEKDKGDNIMRIAVTYENGEIFQHFGHTETFKIYDAGDGRITASEVISTNGIGHGALAELLRAVNADILICGGIGGGAQKALAAAGIKLYGGVSGNADEAVNALISGNLDFNPYVCCDHHDREHGEGHACGGHGCGSNSCGH